MHQNLDEIRDSSTWALATESNVSVWIDGEFWKLNGNDVIQHRKSLSAQQIEKISEFQHFPR